MNDSDGNVVGRNRWRQRVPGLMLHAGRLGLVLAIVTLIRQKHLEFRAAQNQLQIAVVSLEKLRSLYPHADRVQGWDLERGAQTVLGHDGRNLGYVIRTWPTSEHVVGYSGATNTLIAFGTDDRILGIDILESGDTVEHVTDVTSDRHFMRSYNGLTWQQAANLRQVDAVSGATLTSLAVIEGVSHRLGATRPSLRFPAQLTVDELQAFFPNAARIEPRRDLPLLRDVYDDAGRRIGAAFRTSPSADSLNGYQGPSDTLIVLGTDDRVCGMAIRASFDNQPYVDYVKADDYFHAYFSALTLHELSALDLQEAEVEGVSGATMTSMAVARALPLAAAEALIKRNPRRRVVISARDVGTVIVLGLAGLMTFTHLRSWPRWRTLYRFGLVAYLGFLNGDMLSQALLIGWSQSGVPWHLAPGLVLLTLAALSVPVFSRRQMYCHHTCPFGAAQQLVRNRLPWRPRLGRTLRYSLTRVPGGLLAFVLLVAILHLPVNLAAVEPFDAFIFWIAGAATLTIAIIGLTAAAFVPMAYCRFGCPTGALLEYLRMHGRSGRLAPGDFLALGLLAAALIL